MSDQDFLHGINLMLNQSEIKTTQLYLYILLSNLVNVFPQSHKISRGI